VGTTVENWYQSDFSYSVDLIDTFVTIVEKQTKEAILEFQTKKQVEYIEADLGHGIEAQPVETHLGLDDMTWSLDSIFQEYFPSLQRRSALLTVYGFFEYELHKLCMLFQREQQLRLAPKDLQGEGIERSADYLQKVVGLALDKTCKEWQAVTWVREIRNAVVHRDGQRKSADGTIPKTMVNALANLRFYSGDAAIVLDEGFVPQAVAIFKAYFKVIGESIQKNIQLGTILQARQSTIAGWPTSLGTQSRR